MLERAVLDEGLQPRAALGVFGCVAGVVQVPERLNGHETVVSGPEGQRAATPSKRWVVLFAIVTYEARRDLRVFGVPYAGERGGGCSWS